ncbi:hypothetical protein HanRHA438_Chr16g0764131 [Helianthus annuus]|nr:hypothetical protein HanRHA438_Chr16g0764131 [Helianthus annuus]
MTQPQMTNQSAAKSQPVRDGKRRKSTASRRKSTRPPASFPSKKYEPFTGPKIKLKTSSENLVILVNNLNKPKKKEGHGNGIRYIAEFQHTTCTDATCILAGKQL